MLKWEKYRMALLMFQSAPDREVGRCPVRWAYSAREEMFQSAPDREVGRCCR